MGMRVAAALPASARPRPRSSPLARRGARVIGTDALRILVISQESSDGEEGNQDNEDNPNIDAHQSSPCRWFVPSDTQKQKRAPGRGSRGFRGVETMKGIQGSRYPGPSDTIP